MNTEILEGNKLIAEFMNVKIEISDFHYMPEFGRYLNSYGIIEFSEIFRLSELKYHSSWDWLMPVIDKITSLDAYFEYKDQTCSQFSDGGIVINTKYIINTYNDVVEFIKWYNKQKI